ncbi:hypothetical protein CROQUDRAFT_659521, partial [Cronartium quercuum f. sp. fusiforme G11]
MDCDQTISHPSSPPTSSTPTVIPSDSQLSSPTISDCFSDTEITPTINPTTHIHSNSSNTLDQGSMSQPTEVSTSTPAPQISMSQSNYSSIPKLSSGNFHAWRL